MLAVFFIAARGVRCIADYGVPKPLLGLALGVFLLVSPFNQLFGTLQVMVGQLWHLLLVELVHDRVSFLLLLVRLRGLSARAVEIADQEHIAVE